MNVERTFWAGQYQEMLRNFYRMMFGYERIVQMKAIYSSKGKHLGWRLKVTHLRLDEHTKHFLRERGYPVPGKFKCWYPICQARHAKLSWGVSH